MADLKVEVVKITDIQPHPNADRMELAFVGGYQCCVRLGQFEVGGLGVYIPVDSILPEKLESFIFGADAKVKLNKHRVRAIKLRGAIAFGLLLTTDEVLDYFVANRIVAGCVEGYDLTDVLGVTKYQPPAKGIPGGINTNKQAKKHQHPSFTKYTSINHLKKYWRAFKEGEVVWGTEKLHGTNFRAGWVPYIPRTFWQKLKNIFSQSKKWEFVYGSHNVQLMDGSEKTKGGSKGNVYKHIVDWHNLASKIPHGELWYGEIVGAGIQTGYAYGYEEGHPEVYWMDIKDSVTQKYFDFQYVIDSMKYMRHKEKVVPYWKTIYDPEEVLETLNDGRPSYIDDKTTPIEGFVIRPEREADFYGGRLILKVLSDEYLLRKENSDWK